MDAGAACIGASGGLGMLSAAAPDGCSASLNIVDSGTSSMLAFSLHVCATCLSHRTHAAPCNPREESATAVVPTSMSHHMLFAPRSEKSKCH